MKATQAFFGTRKNKTALVVFVDEYGYFITKINNCGGANFNHPVELKLSLKEAIDVANGFLDGVWVED